jgi:predicted nucleotidyltransferase
VEHSAQTSASSATRVLPDWLQASRTEILRVATKMGVTNVRVFGSVARGEDGPDSDLDLLVTLQPGRSLFDLVGLADELGALLGRKVDVVTDDALYWLLRRRILREAVAL